MHVVTRGRMSSFVVARKHCPAVRPWFLDPMDGCWVVSVSAAVSHGASRTQGPHRAQSAVPFSERRMAGAPGGSGFHSLRTLRAVPRAAAPVCVPAYGAGGLPLSTSSPARAGHESSVRWPLTAAWLGVSLVVLSAEHLLVCLLAHGVILLSRGFRDPAVTGRSCVPFSRRPPCCLCLGDTPARDISC